jgi:hypothetical protein
VLVLHDQGHGPCRSARATGISRKQVARLLETEGITREPSRPASARLPEIVENRGSRSRVQKPEPNSGKDLRLRSVPFPFFPQLATPADPL